MAWAYVSYKSNIQIIPDGVFPIQATGAGNDPESDKHILAVPFFFARFADHFGMGGRGIGK